MRVINHPHATKGFTIMEVIIAIALFAIVISVILFLYSNYGKTFASQQAIISAANAARASMDEMQNKTLQTSQVQTAYTFTVQGVSTAIASATTSMAISLPSIDSNGNSISGKSDYAAFYQQSNKLYEIIQPDAASSRPALYKQLTDTLSSLSFTYDNVTNVASSTKVTIDLQTQATARGTVYTSHLQEPVIFRNQ